MALPEPESRFTSSRTPTPALISAWACDCWVVALPLALSMEQVSLWTVHCFLSSVGSAETQRGEDAVSGSRMPTFVFTGAELALVDVEGVLLLPQPASTATSAAATPASTTAVRGVVRMGCAPFLSLQRVSRHGRRVSGLARVMSGSWGSVGDAARLPARSCAGREQSGGGQDHADAFRPGGRGLAGQYPGRLVHVR
jgi:hypothetical protein